MFETFTCRRVEANGVTLNLVVGGHGPPLLLLHGYPQTHAMWHGLAPWFAEAFTVVAPDLRGYGDSDKPPGDAAHLTYSKRMTAKDLLELMTALGFEKFVVVGHDRGARVAHRLALDAPDTVTRLAVLDIAPTYHVFETVDAVVAGAYYHWFFSQPTHALAGKTHRCGPTFLPAPQARRLGRGRAGYFLGGGPGRVRALFWRP